MIDPIRLLLAALSLMSFQMGDASWYGPGFYGQPTASGVIYTPDTWGVAHLILPLGEAVVVISRCGAVSVPVLDRGPYGVEGRILDVSPRVAAALFCDGYGYYNSVPYGMEQVLVIGGSDGRGTGYYQKHRLWNAGY